MTRLLSETEIIAAAAGAGPAKCGVYFLIKDGEVKYVGQSIDIDARLAGHRRRQFDQWHWVPCARDQLLSFEREYLNHLIPPWNSDSTTENIRDKLRQANAPPPPLAPLPLEGIDPKIMAELAEETRQYEAAFWTEGRVMRERMRRVRTMRREPVSLESFGPMPVIGDPLPSPDGA